MDSRSPTRPANSVQALLQQARRLLSHVDNGRLDAELLLAHAMGRSRTWLYTWPDRVVGGQPAARFTSLVRRRAQGTPLAYLTGHKEFWSLSLQVDEHTLVPRPDTELLVQLALHRAEPDSIIVDLGTGCGAIALALASETARNVTATDISPRALAVAAANARRLKLALTLVQADWLTAFSDRSIDIIVSNPPYVRASDPHLQADGVACEPRVALVAGADGLSTYRQIIPQATRCLRTNGWLLLEHGHDQAGVLSDLLDRQGFTAIESHPDSGGITRATAARKISRG